jgi:hypothetical protein
MSLTVMFSEQSNHEIKKLLNSAKFYKDFKGSITYSASYDTIKYVVDNMTS